jgi:hypothetical protein
MLLALTAIFYYDHSFQSRNSTSFLTNIRSGITIRYNFEINFPFREPFCA